MAFPSIKFGQTRLDKDVINRDKSRALRIGPCGIGEEALYLNSFYIDRMYYVAICDISRVFKRVAMSKGGFSGKGVFGSMAYLVVQMKDGTEKQCNFKYEDQVDLFLEQMEKLYPYIPTHSVAAEEKLRAAELAEQAKYIKNLSDKATATIARLEDDKRFLKERPELYEELSGSARQKRIIDGIAPSYRIFAVVVFVAGIVAALFGLASWRSGSENAIYFVLFGMAMIFFIAASHTLPTGRNNKARASREWEGAVEGMANYLTEYDKGEAFDLPARYAHPVIIDRMERVIKMGRAETMADAFDVMKEDLRALNNTVKVSQKEYDEVVKVKPIFLVCDYE